MKRRSTINPDLAIKIGQQFPNINKLSIEELRALNSIVVEEINRKQIEKSITAAKQFSIGQRVKFKQSKYPFGFIEGTIASINTKSITLRDTSDGHSIGWRVAPSLLQPVEEKTA